MQILFVYIYYALISSLRFTFSAMLTSLPLVSPVALYLFGCLTLHRVHKHRTTACVFLLHPRVIPFIGECRAVRRQGERERMKTSNGTQTGE